MLYISSSQQRLIWNDVAGSMSQVSKKVEMFSSACCTSSSLYFTEIQRLAIFGLRNQCHHFGIGMLMVDDQCDNEVDCQ